MFYILNGWNSTCLRLFLFTVRECQCQLYLLHTQRDQSVHDGENYAMIFLKQKKNSKCTWCIFCTQSTSKWSCWDLEVAMRFKAPKYLYTAEFHMNVCFTLILNFRLFLTNGKSLHTTRNRMGRRTFNVSVVVIIKTVARNPFFSQVVWSQVIHYVERKNDGIKINRGFDWTNPKVTRFSRYNIVSKNRDYRNTHTYSKRIQCL